MPSGAGGGAGGVVAVVVDVGGVVVVVGHGGNVVVVVVVAPGTVEVVVVVVVVVVPTIVVVVVVVVGGAHGTAVDGPGVAVVEPVVPAVVTDDGTIAVEGTPPVPAGAGVDVDVVELDVVVVELDVDELLVDELELDVVEEDVVELVELVVVVGSAGTVVAPAGAAMPIELPASAMPRHARLSTRERGVIIIDRQGDHTLSPAFRPRYLSRRRSHEADRSAWERL